MSSSTQQAALTSVTTSSTLSMQSPRTSTTRLDIEEELRESEDESESDLEALSTRGAGGMLSQNERMFSRVGHYLECHGESDLNLEKVDGLMRDAYGATLIHSSGVEPAEAWYQRWNAVVHLQGKVYDLPGGAVGRKYVDLLSEEISHLSVGNFPADRVIVFSALMLQRDRMVKKTADIRRVLERRMSMWRREEFDLLLQEAIRCDKVLRSSHKRENDSSHVVRVFTRLMLKGKVRAAVRWVSEKARGVLKPTDLLDMKKAGGESVKMTVLEALQQKHPNPVIPSKLALLPCTELPRFEEVEITGGHVLRIAQLIQGGAGPGGCDACHWQDSLLRYGAHSARLRESVASLCRRLANSIVPWSEVRGLVASRLIALDKCPGVRPIGVGETLRRIVGKVVCSVTRLDIEEVAGVSQLCAGTKSGIEGAVHALNELFEVGKSDGWGVLLIDAANAFNSLNRIAALWNARVLWPRCSRFLFNTYRGWATLVIRGSESVIYSKEGVTQGDPLAMFIYAIGSLPLISRLRSPDKWVQTWYADDASACGPIQSLREWFLLLKEHGPSFGYFVEPSKSYVVVDQSFVSEAENIFSDYGVKVVHSQRLLGGVIGDEAGRLSYVRELVNVWKSNLESLATIAETEPQVAFSALTKSMQFQWNYVQRVVPGCQSLFDELESVIAEKFLPAIFGCEVSSLERELFSLPARMGGLGVFKPNEMTEMLFNSSKNSTKVIVDAIRGRQEFEIDTHFSQLLEVRAEVVKEKERLFDEKLNSIMSRSGTILKRAVSRACQGHISAWLTVLPLQKSQFDLSAREFRDALAMRYKKPLLNIPTSCDGCGATFDLSHALSCRKGGLIVKRHNEVRDTVGDLSGLVWSPVIQEPIVKEANLQDNTPALRADLAVRGVWDRQTEALFDIRVVDTDAQSYVNRSPMEVLGAAEQEKKMKYSLACEERRGAFTPFCCSVDGMLGREAEFFLRRLGDRLAAKWERSYSDVMCWVRARLVFAVLRSSILCLRGARTKWRGLGLEDGASISLL